jgi:APA family basic amino acid/polyamine antiporter
LIVVVRESTGFNVAIVAVKVTVVLVFLHPGEPRSIRAVRVERCSARPLVDFFAYTGFDAVSTAAQQAKNPQRDMPISIMGSLIICTIFYMAVAAVLTGLVK